MSPILPLPLQDLLNRPPPESSSGAQFIYSHWVKGNPGSEAARQLLHTTYKKRERTVGVLVSDW